MQGSAHMHSIPWHHSLRGEQWPHRFKHTLRKQSRTSQQQRSWCISTNICKCLLTNKAQKGCNVHSGSDQLQGQREGVPCTPELSWGRACPWRWGTLPVYRGSPSATTRGPHQVQMWERITEEKNNWPGHWAIFFMKFQTECPQSKKVHLQLHSTITIP